MTLQNKPAKQGCNVLSARHTHAEELTAKRGTKRSCGAADCGHRFYDLNKDPASCPYCGALFVEAPVVAVTTSRSSYKQKVYTIKQEDDEVQPAALEADVSVDDDTPAVDAEEIPEVEDEDIDESLSIPVEQE